jgi:hypothetical protein
MNASWIVIGIEKMIADRRKMQTLFTPLRKGK